MTIVAAAIVAAVAAAASPAWAQMGPGGPGVAREGPTADGPERERFGPMNGMPGMGGDMAGINQRIARMLAAEAMHQRAIGARMAVSRMMRHMAARLQAMDRNEDGEITEREFLGGMLQIFDRIDRDGDGVIGAGELRQAFAAMGEGDAQFGGPNQDRPGTGPAPDDRHHNGWDGMPFGAPFHGGGGPHR